MVKLIAKTFLFSLFFSVTFITLTGCSALVSPTPTHDPTSTPTKKPTRTPLPSLTPFPSPSPSPSPSPTITASPYPTPQINFENVKFYTAGFLTDWRFFIALQAPEAFQGDYFMRVQNNKQYTCSVINDYPNRLYCSGPLPVVDDWVNFSLYSSPSEQVLYQGRVYVPMFTIQR